MGEIIGAAITLGIIYMVLKGISNLILAPGKKIRAKFDSFVGSSPQSLRLFDDLTKCGMALDPKGEQLYLCQKEQLKRYSFSDVRTWEGGGDRDSKYVDFIMKDIEFPTWKIRFHSTTADPDKWVEVINQAVGEGGLKDAA